MYSFRSFVLGLLSMLVISIVVENFGEPMQQFRQVQQLKHECEKDLPRSENCVIVALPKSTD